MRLTEFEINAIKQCALEIFGDNVQVFLFGSRVDDSKKGGDIGSYIRTEADFRNHLFCFKVSLCCNKRLNLIVRLKISLMANRGLINSYLIGLIKLQR